MNEYESKLKEAVKGRIVVYIDAANLEQSVKGMFVRPDEMPRDRKYLSTDKVGWFVDYRSIFDIANFRSAFLKIKAKSPGQSPEPRS